METDPNLRCPDPCFCMKHVPYKRSKAHRKMKSELAKKRKRNSLGKFVKEDKGGR